MENKFLTKYLFILCLFLSSYFFSQTKKINFLIMIDEKPCLVVNNLQFLSSFGETIDGDYNVGTIDLSDENYNKLINEHSVNFDISFETLLPKSLLVQKYTFSLPKVFFNQKYIIVNIFSKANKAYKKRYLEKNNQEYYVVIETPNSMKFD